MVAWQWADEAVRHFMVSDAVGWVGPDGRLVSTPLHGHLEAFKNDPELRGFLPSDFDWSAADREIMDALYGQGWGRVGTWGREPFRWMELECFVEHLGGLRKHAQTLAELVERRLNISPVFTREDALPRPHEGRKRGRPHESALASIARGATVGWLSPQGELICCHPFDPLSFLREGPRPGIESLARWLKEADDLYERWQSNQFAEDLDPNEHPEWHRFYADEYVAPPEVVEMLRKKALAKGWGFAESDGRRGVRLLADPDFENVLRQVLDALDAEQGFFSPRP